MEEVKEEEEELASRILSSYLIWSVMVSLFIIIIGTVEYLATGSSGYLKLTVPVLMKTTGGTVGAFPHYPIQIVLGTVKVKSFAIIQLGILLLILSPLGRIFVQVFIFLKEKDRYFVPIGVAVFIILILSLYLSRFFT